MIVNSWSAGKKAVAGYGLAMLMVFLATTVMVGASMQMMAAPITMAYLGAASQDNLAAQQLAQAGMDVIQADLQTKFDAGVAITTGYSYPLTSMSMPDSPDALGGATTVVGSYSGAIGAINGNTALVKVTATVGVGTYTYNKLIALSRSIYPLDNVTGATAAYGLRKLDKDYVGSAIRVRRASDDTEQDIGFDASGGLDKAALLTFLNGGVTTYPKPLDSVGSAAAAYSLRKLRTAYTGSAIRVRRSSDNAELDIGFTSSGDLDVSALVDFVGAGSGYVTTWYDQSGNANSQTQATTTVQPLIVAAGVLVTVNGRPAIRFDGVNDFIAPPVFNITNNFTIIALARPTSTHELDPKNGDFAAGTSGQKYLIGPDTRAADQGAGFSLGTNGVAIYNHSSGGLFCRSTAPLSIGSNPVISTMVYTNKQPFLYVNSQLSDVSFAAASANVYAGLKIGGRDYENYFAGEVSEVIYYGSSLSTANRQTIENNQARYYQLTMEDLGFANPLDTVTGAAAAYGLRKLRTAYAGNAIQVRRSSDNTTANVGFDAKNNLNISTLMNFCGTASCYVTTWYDQSGSNNATQATASYQPRIVNNGILNNNLNGRPSITFDGIDDTLLTTTYVADFTLADLTANLVLSNCSGGVVLHKGNANSSWEYGEKKLWMGSDYAEASKGLRPSFVGYGNNYAFSSGTISSGKGIVTFTWDYLDPVNGTPTYYINGVSTGLSYDDLDSEPEDTATNILQIGTGPGASYYQGDIAEISIYPQLLGNRETIEYNQMSYFNINSAFPGTGFVTKWYDQSGNSRDVSQPTGLLQPTLLWDNRSNQPVISFNGRSNSLYRTDGFPTNSDYTKNAVFSYRDASRTNNIVSTYTGSASAHALYFNGTNYLRLFHNGSFAVSATAMTINQPYTVFGTYNNATMEGITYQGVTQVGAGTATVNISNASLVLGAHGGSNFLDGTISEATIYNRILNATERQLLYGDQSVYWMTP